MFFIATVQVSAQVIKEVDRTTERELKVNLSSSFGSVRICKSDDQKFIKLSGRSADGATYDVSYTVQNRIGYLELSLGSNDQSREGKHTGVSLDNFKSHDWVLQIGDDVPVSLEIEMGVGKGDLNLTGLNVKDLNISSGASDVLLAFDQPNESIIENLNIESGVSKFYARNLGNANFRHLRFQGGVGTFTLDFSGRMRKETDVDVEVGMGVAALMIPWEVGAKVEYEQNWVSTVDCSDDFTSSSDSEYTSKNYETAGSKMSIRIESGVGSIRIRRP